MSFLPKNYEVPASEGNYFKFEQGENRFRIMSKPILGMEYWVTDPKDKTKRLPKRVEMGVNIPVDEIEINPKTGREDLPKHFWAMVIWNYKLEKAQILEITQKSIQRTLTGLSKDDDWGDPLSYDVVVEKTGEKLETEYQVRPKPKKEMDAGIVQMVKDMDIKLEVLFEGGDPFKPDKITDEDLQELAKKI